MEKKTIQKEETEYLITQIRAMLSHVESVADENRLELFFKRGECPRLRSLVKRLTALVESHSN